MTESQNLTNKQCESLLNFQQETFMFPQFEEAYRSILESLALYRRTGLIDHKSLYGESGCGKTTVCKVIEGINPRVSERERDLVPVLYASIPALATISSVAECLLAELGDALPSVGSNSSKTERLIKLIQACGVDMLILDELQHVHDRGQSPTIYKVADWIKNLADRIGRPVILIGIPRAGVLLDTNEQFRRRFGARLVLDRMTLDTEAGSTEFVELASALIDALPIQCGLNLKSYSIVERLFYASDGRVGYLVTLFHRALMLVFTSGGTTINGDVLERAFIKQIWMGGVGQLNPFNEGFCFRRLDKLGEPFFSAPATAKSHVRIRKSGGRT